MEGLIIMKRKSILMLILCLTLALASCGKQKNKVENNPSEMDTESKKVIGGVEAVTEAETVSMGGILDGASQEDVDELGDSIDVEKIKEMSKEEQEKVVGGLSVLADQHNMIVDRINKNFEEKDINIDEDSGKITLEENILFDKDKYVISKNGKKYLDSFIKIYADVILSQEIEQYISEIQVIGHTDTSGEYSYNQKLSEKRAEAVRKYCLVSTKNNLSDEQREKLSVLLKAIGKSYDEPIYDENNNVDMEKSRRVEFKFMMNLSN